MKISFVVLFIAIFMSGCGCFFPCLTGGQLGYNYFGCTPGMACVVENQNELRCGPNGEEIPELEAEENEDESEKEEEKSYVF